MTTRPDHATRRTDPPGRFVRRESFAEASSDAPDISIDAFRADQQAKADHALGTDVKPSSTAG